MVVVKVAVECASKLRHFVVIYTLKRARLLALVMINTFKPQIKKSIKIF